MNAENNNLARGMNSGNVTIIAGGVLCALFLYVSVYIFGDWVSFTSKLDDGLEVFVFLGVLLYLFPVIVYASSVIEGYRSETIFANGRRKIFVVIFASALFLLTGKYVNLFVSINYVAWTYTFPGMLALSWIGNFFGGQWKASMQ